MPKLERALVWDPAGHLADAAVAALADGELTLLPVDAVQHAEGCPACTARVGQAALFALGLAESLDADFAHALADATARADALEAAPRSALALASSHALARVEVAAPGRAPVGDRPQYAHTSAALRSRAEPRISTLAPPAPLPVTAVVAALLVALVAGAPWLSTLQAGSLAEQLARLARVLAPVFAAARAPGVAELAWLAAGVLGLVGAVVARTAARAHGRLAEGLR